MEPAISVIIPMYNAEKYIGECLTSLASQTFQDFEVIVVDDRSTDNSRAVVENFFATFGDRLNLIRLSSNSGCAAVPRNYAMTKARGKYVYFLDSDDLLTDTALAELCEVAECFNADVVHAEKCLAFFEVNGKICADPVSFQEGAFVTEPTLETFDISERIKGFTQKRFMWWSWNKLFRRQYLLDNQITFPALKQFEDFVFVLKCLVTARNYVRVPFVNCCYRLREDSLSHKVQDPVSFLEDSIKIFRVLDDFMSGEKFFRDNPQYKYPILDLFMEGQLKLTAKALSTIEPAALFNFFCEKIFSANPQANIALTTYLFIKLNKKILEVSN